MMRFVLISILGSLCYFSQLFAIEEYPSWFLYPKNYPGIIVGYSYGGHSARTDAENMYCAYKSCVVNGTLEIFEDTNESQWLKNSDYYYYYSPDSVLKIQGKLFGIDSFMTNILTGDYIAAYSFDQRDSLSKEWINARQLKAPPWVEKTFWEDERYAYGVGLFTSRRNENDAWKTAEEQAIFNILTNLAVGFHRIKILYKDQTDGESSFQEISFLRIKYYLKDIEIVERYPDLENQLFYVLVRIAKKNIISPMLRR
ncbi:hypothetical protein [Caldithrix abyssi]